MGECDARGSPISQQIDYLSYHDYMFSNVQLGAQWNTYNGTMSVYQKTQNTGAGPLDVYLNAAKLVGLGKQPQGKNLPIYNSEYNLNWNFSKNCCANDYTYSPVWNGMYIADVLNSVYVGSSKHAQPDGVLRCGRTALLLPGCTDRRKHGLLVSGGKRAAAVSPVLPLPAARRDQLSWPAGRWLHGQVHLAFNAWEWPGL